MRFYEQTISQKKINDTFYFEDNIKQMLDMHHQHLSHEIYGALNRLRYQSMELYFIRKLKMFFNLAGDGEVVRACELYAAVAMSERVLLLFYQQGVKVYTFDTFFDLRKFLIATHIDWLIGDKDFFINPDKVMHIEHEFEKRVGVVFKNFKCINFFTLQVPGRFLYAEQLFVRIEANHSRLPLTVNLRVKRI